MRPETEYRGAADIAQSQPDSLSQKDGRAAHNTDTCMQTGRYMRRQKYTLSKTPQNPLSYRPIRSTEKKFSCHNPPSRTIRAVPNPRLILWSPYFCCQTSCIRVWNTGLVHDTSINVLRLEGTPGGVVLRYESKPKCSMAHSWI